MVGMKTIKEPRKNIALLWRKPKRLLQQTVYRPMKFILKAQTDDGLLLYNVVTSEMVLLNETEVRIFERQQIQYSAELDELIDRHFLVPDGFNENRSIHQLREILKKLEPVKRISSFTILPTTECNARCFYCYESDHPHCTMTKQIAADTVTYIAEKCNREPVSITWFGGEPLVGARRISQICDGLRDKEIEYNSSIVTNAYLFDEDLIHTAKDVWHLSLAQITLDGTENVYNKTKAYIHPKENPYQRVLRNISGLLEQGIAVNIRFNVSSENAKDLFSLVDELDDRFGGNKGFSCYAHAVYDDVGYAPISYESGIKEYVDEQTIALEVKLREKRLLGSLAKLPALHVVYCLADSDSGQLIYPDGTIGKCENKSSLEGIGDIYHGITNEDMAFQYKETKRISDCEDCPLLPNCINLTVCPETGCCTKIKLEWKLNRYTALMKELYYKSMNNQKEIHSQETDQFKCDS